MGECGRSCWRSVWSWRPGPTPTRPPSQKQTDPCGSLTGAALGDCRICQKELPYGPNSLWDACQRRLAGERVELTNLQATIDGIEYETPTDDELDALAETERPSVERFWDLLVELAGQSKDVSETKKAGAIEATMVHIRQGVAKEKACRADKKCMAARAAKAEAKRAEEQFFDSVVQPICTADQAREAALAAMARERANPSGYVNKSFLHEQGAIVQDAQDQIAAAGPAYAKVRHHPWKGWRPECTTPQ